MNTETVYLYGTDYRMIQHPDMFHHNSDTEILGRYAIVREKDTVLDIGCGSGALLLYAAMHHPVSLTGIDIAEENVSAARENMVLNQVSADIRLSSLQQFYPDRLFSLILCNPPYFQTADPSLRNEKPLLARARHEIYLKPAELFHHVNRLLADNGTFYLVHRPERIPEILAVASENHLHAVRMRLAYGTMNGRAKTVLYAFRKGGITSCTIEKPYYLDNRNSF